MWTTEKLETAQCRRPQCANDKRLELATFTFVDMHGHGRWTSGTVNITFCDISPTAM